MSQPEEFKEKFKMSWGLYVFSLLLAFNIGILYATMLSSKEDIVNNKKAARDYTEQEVGGLRADWERHNHIIKDEVEDLSSRVKELEEYHKE